MPAVVNEPVQVRLQLSRTPTVGIPSLRTALFAYAELGGDVDAFHKWLLDKHADVDIRTAVWARVRAFGRWQNTDSVRESDRLWREGLELERSLGLEIDPPSELHAEAVARVGAAAKCPLDACGSFAGFAGYVEKARKAMRSTPAGASVN